MTGSRAARAVRRVTVVGAGFSGTLTAIRLLHFARTPLEICLLEREEGYRHGGIAFGRAATTWSHMLNIQAGRITLRRERPEDFLEWANDEADRSDWPRAWQYHVFGVTCVVPRRIFSQYLAERLRSAAADARPDVTLRELSGEAVDVRADGSGYTVTYADCGADGAVHELPSDQVVLATGHLPPVRAPFHHRILHSDRFVADPYAPGVQERYASFDPDETVLVTGTALSAFDTVVSLVHAGHRGRVLLCSRGGHLHDTYPPDHEHDIWQVRRPPFLDEEELTPETVVAGIRAEYARLRAEKGTGVTPAVFAERVMKAWEPYVIELISRMKPADVRMLLDRYKSLIVTHRTSTVREIGSVVRDRMRDFNGAPRTVSVVAAPIRDLRPAAGGTKIRAVFEGHSDLLVDRVVNCLGNTTDYEHSGHPLWHGLVNDQRVARPHSKTHRGIEVGPHGQFVDAAGHTVEGLFAVGPMRQGDETARRGRLGAFVFSIGTLRNQCFDTAMEMLRGLQALHGGEPAATPGEVHQCLTRGTEWIAADLTRTAETDTARLRGKLLARAQETVHPHTVAYLQAEDRTERDKLRMLLDEDLAEFGAEAAREFGLDAGQVRRLVSLLGTVVEKYAVHQLCDITRLAGWDSAYAQQVRHAPKKGM